MITPAKFSGFFPQNRNKANRPLIRPEMAPVDWLLEGVALLGVVTVFGYALYFYPKLPDVIPSHFNAAGKADDYSPKDSFWFLPGLTVFIYIMLTLIVRIPHSFNFLVTITPENARKQYTLAVRFIRYLKVIIIWLFFFIVNAMAKDVRGSDAEGLGLWFLPVFMGAIFIPMITYFILSGRHK
jgi:uncharacterized membrane protein